MASSDTKPGGGAKLGDATSTKPVIITSAGEFIQVAVVGSQPQPVTQGLEALREALAQAVKTRQPVSIKVAPTEKPSAP